MNRVPGVAINPDLSVEQETVKDMEVVLNVSAKHCLKGTLRVTFQAPIPS